jgi:hypothetical protein
MPRPATFRGPGNLNRGPAGPPDRRRPRYRGGDPVHGAWDRGGLQPCPPRTDGVPTESPWPGAPPSENKSPRWKRSRRSANAGWPPGRAADGVDAPPVSPDLAARYEDEVSAVLDAHTSTSTTFIDLLLGALDAHLHDAERTEGARIMAPRSMGSRMMASTEIVAGVASLQLFARWYPESPFPMSTGSGLRGGRGIYRTPARTSSKWQRSCWSSPPALSGWSGRFGRRPLYSVGSSRSRPRPGRIRRFRARISRKPLATRSSGRARVDCGSRELPDSRPGGRCRLTLVPDRLVGRKGLASR